MNLADPTDARFSAAQREQLEAFEGADEPAEVAEVRETVERVARALAEALRDDLGERGLNWEPGIDVARRLLGDPRVNAALAASPAEVAVRRVEALAEEFDEATLPPLLNDFDRGLVAGYARAAARIRTALAPQAGEAGR